MIIANRVAFTKEVKEIYPDLNDVLFIRANVVSGRDEKMVIHSIMEAKQIHLSEDDRNQFIPVRTNSTLCYNIRRRIKPQDAGLATGEYCLWSGLDGLMKRFKLTIPLNYNEYQQTEHLIAFIETYLTLARSSGQQIDKWELDICGEQVELILNGGRFKYNPKLIY